MAEKENSSSVLNNPYIGPRTFQTEDAPLFFGREKEAQDLVSVLIGERIVLFYAQSGAGKSSLLNTRIIPKLKEANYEVLPIGRVSGFSGLDVDVSNIYVYNLITGLQERDELPLGAATMSIDSFLNNLVEVDGKHYYDDKFDYGNAAELKPRVLLIDQFEELLTTNTFFWKQRDEFFLQIAEALTEDDQLWLMFTMREDFIAGLDPYLHHLPNKLRHRFFMQRLDRKAAREAITQPAKLTPFNRPFMEEAADLLLDNLLQIKNIDGDGETLIGQFVESVQLQAVCYQMWEELKNHPGTEITKDDVVMYADVDTAMERFYEDTIRDTMKVIEKSEIINTSELELRVWFETQLITESGTRNLVFRGENDTGGLKNSVVDFIISKFILRPVVRPGGIWYELVHDRFVTSVQTSNQEWRLEQPLPRLAQDWVSNDRNDAFLLDGAQLARFEETEWRVLGSLVVEFMEAAQEAQAKREAAEQAEKEAQRQRELEQARALAAAQEAERKKAEELAEEQRLRAIAQEERAQEQEAAAQRQRQLSRIGYVLAGLAVILAIIAGIFGYQSLQQANTAATAEAEARDSEALAKTAEAEASNAEGTALFESIRAFEQQGTAEAESTRAVNAQGTAEAAEKIARLAGQIPELNIKTLSLLRQSNDNDELAILLSLEAIQLSILIDDFALDDAVEVLFDVVFSDPYFVDLALPDSHNRPDPVLSITYRSDGQQLAYGTSEGAVIVRDLTDVDTMPLTLSGHEDPVWSLAYNPSNENELASASGDGTIRVWNITDPVNPHVLTGHEESIKSLAYSSDGTLLASASNDNTIRVWNLATLTTEAVLEGHEGAIWSVTFHPENNNELASASTDGTIRIWNISDLLSGASTVITPTVASASFEGGEVLSVKYFSNGTGLVSADSRGEVRPWSWFSDSNPPSLNRNGNSTFSSNSTWSLIGNPIAEYQFAFTEVTTATENTVRQWEAFSSSNNTTILSSYDKPIWSVAYNPNGAQLAYGDFDGTVRLWNIKPPSSDLMETAESLLEFGCNQVWRNLTWAEWQQYLEDDVPLYRLTCPELALPSDLAEAMSEWDKTKIDDQIDEIKQQSRVAAELLRQQLDSIVTSTPTPPAAPQPESDLVTVIDCDYAGENQWEWHEIQNDIRVGPFTGDRVQGCAPAPSIMVDRELVVDEDSNLEFDQCVVKWQTSDNVLIAFLSGTFDDGYGGLEKRNLGVVAFPDSSRVVESLTARDFTLHIMFKNGFSETLGPVEVPIDCEG